MDGAVVIATDIIAATGQPCTCMEREMKAELVSCVRPLVNSFPIVNIPIRIVSPLSRPRAETHESCCHIPQTRITSCRMRLPYTPAARSSATTPRPPGSRS
jgi:hypothetical protein